MGNYPSLQLVDTLLIKEFCQNPKKFRKLNRFKHSRKCFNQSLLFTEDDVWSNQRKIIQHSFNHEQLKAILPKLERVILSHASDLKTRIQINGNFYNIQKENPSIMPL
jgi:cytochrome P450